MALPTQSQFWPAPYSFNAQAEYANPGINRQQNQWAQSLSQATGIPVEWTRTQGMLEMYLKAMQGQTESEALRASAGLSTPAYQGGPMSTNVKTQFEELQQRGRQSEEELQQRGRQSELAALLQAELEKLKLEALLKSEAREDVWSKITPYLEQFGMGGGGGGGTSGLAGALSSADFNPIRMQAEEARRRIYSGGGSLRQRGTQLSSITGSELSAIAQALSGGRAAALTASTGLSEQLINLLGQFVK